MTVPLLLLLVGLVSMPRGFAERPQVQVGLLQRDAQEKSIDLVHSLKAASSLAFDAMDLDRDGTISREEFENGLVNRPKALEDAVLQFQTSPMTRGEGAEQVLSAFVEKQSKETKEAPQQMQGQGAPGTAEAEPAAELEDPPGPDDLKALVVQGGPVDQAMTQTDTDANTLKESSKTWVKDSKEINEKAQKIKEEADATGKELSAAHKGVHKDSETPPDEVLKAYAGNNGTKDESAGQDGEAGKEDGN